MELVSAGRVRMPKFQREFKWEASDQRDLLDSIYRGYPVGTLLLWKNPPSGSEASRGLRGAAQPHGELFLVVDGQQRITTLWNALGRRPEPKESALVFEMKTETFRSRPLTRDELEGLPPSGCSEDQLPAVPVYLRSTRPCSPSGCRKSFLARRDVDTLIWASSFASTRSPPTPSRTRTWRCFATSSAV